MTGATSLARLGVLLGLGAAALAPTRAPLPGATAQTTPRPSLTCAACPATASATWLRAGRWPGAAPSGTLGATPPPGAGARTFVIHGLARTSGLIPWHAHKTMTLDDSLALVVDLGDGHVDVTAVGMTIPGRGPALAFQRTWDSTLAQLPITSTVGQGWVSSLTPRLTASGTNAILYSDDSGAVWQFPATGAPGPAGGYATPPGLSWQLTASPGGYTLTDTLSGESHGFDRRGRYLFVSDSYGNRNTVGYRDGLPVRDTNDGGRALSFSYQHGLLSAVASPLWVSSNGAQGQQVTYRYNTTGQLTSFTRGAGTSDAITTRFAYHGALLVAITLPGGAHWRLSYDGQGRLLRVTVASS